MKLRIMTSAVTAIHHAHVYRDTLTVYCLVGAAAGSSPESDPDLELVARHPGQEERDDAALRALPQGQAGDGT